MSPANLGHLAMLAFSALVAGSFALGATMANDIDPPAFTAVRFWMAAGFIAAYAQLRGGFERKSFAAPWRYAILGGLFAIYFVLMFEGLKTAPPVSMAAVFTLVPFMAAGFAFALLRQRMTRRMAAALSIGRRVCSQRLALWIGVARPASSPKSRLIKGFLKNRCSTRSPFWRAWG